MRSYLSLGDQVEETNGRSQQETLLKLTEVQLSVQKPVTVDGDVSSGIRQETLSVFSEEEWTH